MSNIFSKENEKLWDKCNEIERKLSNFTDVRHGQNSGLITENSEALFDVAEVVEENSEASYDLAEVLASLEERIEALEGGKS